MSRRSLRLDDGLLDRGLPCSSASFSVGGASWRSSSRSLKSRRSQQLSVSCSESLLLSSPRAASLLNSSLHSVASDASLLSSLLDDSSVQETTLLDSFWGLDQDIDPKESTIIADQSTVLADRTLIGPDGRCPRHPVQTLSRVYCKDCELHSDRKESTYCTSSSGAAATGPRPSEPVDPEMSTIYCRDRSRKTPRTGVLVSVCSRSAACVVSLLTLLYHQLMLQKQQDVTDVLQLWLDSCLLFVRRAAAGCVSVLAHTWQVCRGLASKLPQVNVQSDNRHGGRSSHCRAMSLKENQKELHPNGSLCFLSDSSWFSFLCCSSSSSVLPAVNITEWRTVVSDVPDLSSIYGFMSPQSQSAEGAVEESKEVQPYEEPLYSRPPLAETPSGEEEASAAEVDESARLVHLEQSLTALWERVEAGGWQAEQRHREVLRLYTGLQQQQQQQLVFAQGGGSGKEPWLRGLLEQQLDQQLEQLRTRLDEERRQWEQDLSQQQSQTSRLDQLELQLHTLAAKTEEVQSRQKAAATVSQASTLPAAVSVGVDRQSHEALLAEVARLEAALEDVRRDVEGLSGCWDDCRQLDRVQHTVSAQVREEVRSLVYGNQLALRGGASGDTADLPESLLQWLSQRYVSGADLQASLASLELSILQNISQQLEQHRSSDEAAREAVLHATRAAGAAVTQEDVHEIVKNALRLFSQDRTGLADYALESGGGSILSTRCSETYETKAALLSLFGVPLWYFSQSPRAVIQPDVHPGNCWAFRGSTGFVVIRLSMRILPTAFSLEHIPKALAPSGALRSAPRDFSVYGLDDESQERGKLLGSYTYDEDGEALQTYPVTEESDRAFQIIEVQVLSNWGHPEYTCMYRFRVHGTPRDA
ncbi:uncharacterized protein ABDE67_020014 [Symphorus nematophorus]